MFSNQLSSTALSQETSEVFKKKSILLGILRFVDMPVIEDIPVYIYVDQIRRSIGGDRRKH